jgi:signal transduction histidine kinase
VAVFSAIMDVMSGPQVVGARLKRLVSSATLADALMLGGLAAVLLWHWVGAVTLWRGYGPKRLVTVSLPHLEMWLLGTAPLLTVVLGAADRRRGPQVSGQRRLLVVLLAVSGLIGLTALIARIVVGPAPQPVWNWRFAVLVASLCGSLLATSAARRQVLGLLGTAHRVWATALLVVVGAAVASVGWGGLGRSVSGLAGIVLGYWVGDRLADATTRFDRSGSKLRWGALVAGAAVVTLVAGTGAYPLPLDGRGGWAGSTAAAGSLLAVGVLTVLVSGSLLLKAQRAEPATPRPSDVALVRTLAAARLAAWGWLAFAYLQRWDQVAHPVPARWSLAATAAASLLLAWLAWAHPENSLRTVVVLGELGLALCAVAVDPWVFRAHGGPPLFWGLWPVVAVLAVAIAYGGWRGALAGGLAGLIRLTALFTPAPSGRAAIPSAVVFFTLSGAAVGYLALLLRRSEAEVATARVREELSVRLHDGVLQTLGIVRRRTDDPVLASLARESERELRDYLSATATTRQHTRLGDGLVSAASRFERLFDVKTHVLVPDDLPDPEEGVVEALLAATNEVLANAGKHAHAENVYLFAEPTMGGVLISVRDDGCGFDESSVATGQGLRHSVRRRLWEIDGRVEIKTAPGLGTEVCLWLP